MPGPCPESQLRVWAAGPRIPKAEAPPRDGDRLASVGALFQPQVRFLERAPVPCRSGRVRFSTLALAVRLFQTAAERKPLIGLPSRRDSAGKVTVGFFALSARVSPIRRARRERAPRSIGRARQRRVSSRASRGPGERVAVTRFSRVTSRVTGRDSAARHLNNSQQASGLFRGLFRGFPRAFRGRRRGPRHVVPRARLFVAAAKRSDAPQLSPLLFSLDRSLDRPRLA